MQDYNKANLIRLLFLFAACLLLVFSIWSIADGNLFSRIVTGVLSVVVAVRVFKKEFHDKG